MARNHRSVNRSFNKPGTRARSQHRGGGGSRAGGTAGREERLKMRTRSDVYVDPPGEGPATKVNKGGRIGDERIVREWRKSTRTNCVRVAKSKLLK